MYATKLKAFNLTNVKKVGLTFGRLFTARKLSNFIFIYEINPSDEDPFMQYYQPNHEFD